jgi:hypothetical protein
MGGQGKVLGFNASEFVTPSLWSGACGYASATEKAKWERLPKKVKISREPCTHRANDKAQIRQGALPSSFLKPRQLSRPMVGSRIST